MREEGSDCMLELELGLGLGLRSGTCWYVLVWVWTLDSDYELRVSVGVISPCCGWLVDESVLENAMYVFSTYVHVHVGYST